jgi:PAS domain S-box-containing protein
MKQEMSQYSTDLFRLIAENARDFAIFVTDLDGRVVSWNPGVESLLGYAEREWVGRHASVIFTPEDRERDADRREMETALSEGRAEDKRWHVRKDGSRFWADGLLMLLKGGGVEPLGFAKIMRDATAQKEAETRLREREERYRALFDSIDEGFCVLQMLFDEDDRPVDYRFLELNPSFERLTGISAELALSGRTVRELVPDLEPHWAETYGRVALTGEPVRFENHSEAMGRWFDVYALRVGRPEHRRVALVFNNITERKRAEAERERLLRSLEFERSRLSEIFTRAPAFVATLRGPEHVFELYNPAYLQLVGHRDLLGKTAREVFPDVEGQGFFQLLDGVYRTGEPYEGREIPIRLQRTPGAPPEERFIDLLYQPLFDADGSVSGIFAHGVDITEQVEARKRAEEANRVKDDFLATLSHELRTPLTSILGWARLLQSTKFDEEGMARALATIERNAQAQTQLIDDLLDTSRIITGKLRLDVRAVDLAVVVSAAADTARPAAELKDIRLQVLLDPQAGPVRGDPDRLQQVVWNLLSNAVKFTQKGGHVRVSVERADSNVEIVVADDGSGIAPEFLPHVFDRFRQADQKTTRAHGGLGLGLAIVRQIVELHGGSIGVESAGPGHGATFRVMLPLVGAQVVTERAAAAGEQTRPAQAGVLNCPPELGGLRVLVVDDDPDTREFVRSVLEMCGAEATAVGSAVEGLGEVERMRPDVLVADLGMPERDGYWLIKQVRALSEKRGGKTPAVALTAYARPEDRVRSLRAGFQHHVTKPAEPQELVALVANLAGRSRGE